MEFDLGAMSSGDGYRLLTSVIVPRPIAWVTSLGEEGAVNAAPFSFFNLLGSDPPVVGIGVGNRKDGLPKDTAHNIELSGDFVVNLVDEENAERMNVTAIDFPRGVSEIQEAHLSLTPSLAVTTPRITQSPIHLECRHVQTLEIGRNRILLGEVVHVHVRVELLDGNGRPRTGDLRLIGRMHGGGWYARTSDLFDLPRLNLAEWREKP